MNFFHHKDLENHLLQLCPKVVKHPVCMGSETENKLVQLVLFLQCEICVCRSGVNRFSMHCLIRVIVGLIVHSSPTPYLKWQNVLNCLNSAVSISKRNAVFCATFVNV